MSFFPILACCNHVYCIFICPHRFLLQHTFFLFVFVSNPVLCCPCLLPLPSSIFVYGVWLLFHSLYFYPTSHKVSLSSFFPLPLHPNFLALGCSIIYSFFILPPPIPYSLYIDNDSAHYIFHPLWHCHSCLCCCDLIAIELLWLRDSLIVWMVRLVVKSIQCAEWLFTSHKAVLKISVIVKSNWQSIRVWEVDGQNLLGGGNSTLVDSRSQWKWGGGGIMAVGPSIGGGWASDVWSVCILGNLEFLKKIKVPGFRIRIFIKLQFPPEVTRLFPPIIFSKNFWEWNGNGGTFFF